MKRIFVCGTVVACMIASTALAGERYAARPGVIISPDLTAPWVMQLSQPRLKIRRALPAPVTIERETIIGASVTTRKLKRRSSIDLPEPPQENSNIITIGPDGLVQNRSLPKPKKAKSKGVSAEFLPQEVAYDGGEAAGTIVIDTNQRFLFLVGEGGTARRYGVGVGKPGFEWAGEHKIAKKAEWPVWTPPEEMKARVKAKEGRILPDRMEGGPDNPLGARAMYLGNSLYRIHGTNQPWSIGSAVSSGCIRMRNEDVVDLYERVKVGTRVIVM